MTQVTTPTTGRRRRTRVDGQAETRLAALTAARDRLDAGQAERRRREDAALACYASLVGETDMVNARRDEELAELERRRQAVLDVATAELAGVAERQAAVLVELTELGRPADELATLFDLPVKRVRALLREHRVRATSADLPATPTTDA